MTLIMHPRRSQITGTPSAGHGSASAMGRIKWPDPIPTVPKGVLPTLDVAALLPGVFTLCACSNGCALVVDLLRTLVKSLPVASLAPVRLASSVKLLPNELPLD